MRLRWSPDFAAPVSVLVALALGGTVYATAGPEWSARAWMLGLVVTGAPVVWRTVRGAFHGHFATDVVASFAIVGAAVLLQPAAGLVVVLMQTGGEALEHYAEGRASAALRQLEADAPRIAHRLGAGGEVTDLPVDEIAVGDALLVRPGELIPCDVVVVGGRSHVDTSRITGEPMPVAAEAESRLLSGTMNGEGSLTVRATALAAESQYARIVQLVKNAHASKAPMQRVADRYAAWFTPLTLLVCAGAWMMSHDSMRVLAILMVATPCPLILATPVAIIGGINRAARRHIIVRNGGAIEALASVNMAVLDKTGTVTVGIPRVTRVDAQGGISEAELVRLTASLEQGSSHLVGRAVVDEARERGIALAQAFHATESAGRGVTGMVDGREVSIGGRTFIEGLLGGGAGTLAGTPEANSALRAWVAVDGAPVGWIEFDDQPRPELRRVLADLATLGVRRVVLLSGDDAAHTSAVAAAAGIGEAFGGLLPEDKVQRVRAFVEAGAHVLMVGDGTNDAPALSTASVGIALAGHGGGIAAEAADAVILTDDLGRVVEAVRISRETVKIARQSIRVGLLLSAVAMGFAAAGFVVPVAGALLQEVIDVAVILNALRAARTH